MSLKVIAIRRQTSPLEKDNPSQHKSEIRVQSSYLDYEPHFAMIEYKSEILTLDIHIH